MKTIAVIPARMGSSRFPGKPLAKILGLSMIEHVWRRAKLSRSLDEVYVATCDREIKRAVEAFGGKAVMTSASHERGTDRIAEAAGRVPRADLVVNIQGDEPLLHPSMVDAAVAPFRRDRALACVNLMAPIDDQKDFEDRNEIKVVTDLRGYALYMSREPVPTGVRIGRRAPRFKQVCVIPFRRAALFRFARLSPTPLEVAESIDMMRFIEHGVPVKMVLSPAESASVDTPADLRYAAGIMRRDPITKKYLRIPR